MKRPSRSYLFLHQDRPEDVYEKDDCTVLAMTNATGIPYGKVHDLLEDFGRVWGTGFPLAPILGYDLGEQRVFLGHRFRCVLSWPNKQSNIWSFARNNPEGRFIALTVVRRGLTHLTCVVDGYVVDSMMPPTEEKVGFAWEVTKYE